MSCYHPLIGIPKGDGTYQVVSSRNNDLWLHEKGSDPGHILIPCGRCIGCKLDYSRSWADRMMLELESMKKGVFVTLTYDDEHLPLVEDEESGTFYATLVKRDCQLFLKRLRKYFYGKKIRFYLAGEYGPSTGRPHYHAILFGIGLDDFPDLEFYKRNKIGQQYFISSHLNKIWSSGFVVLADVTWETCAYVARYVTKKVIGPDTFDIESFGVQKEFASMSRKPGIGRLYLEQHPDCLDYSSIYISTPEGGKRLQIPKYFLDQMNKKNYESSLNPLYNPVRYDRMMDERMRYAVDRNLLELKSTELKGLDYYSCKEQIKKESVKSLRRSQIEL